MGKISFSPEIMFSTFDTFKRAVRHIYSWFPDQTRFECWWLWLDSRNSSSRESNDCHRERVSYITIYLPAIPPR